MNKVPHPAEPKVEVDDEVHEHILANVPPEVEKRDRAKSKERAIKLHRMSPEAASGSMEIQNNA
jgi:hypothetical protein